MDADNGTPLPYANIVLLDTERGAISLSDGTFQIDEVPPGTYAVQASYVGYEKALETGVVVRSGTCAQLNFKLSLMPIVEGRPVVVGGQPPDFRVGCCCCCRSGEISTYVDGVPVRDPLAHPVFAYPQRAGKLDAAGLQSKASGQESTPPLFSLSSPNPVSDRLSYTIHSSGGEPVTIRVYDLSGRPVRTLIDQALPEGEHGFHWDLTPADGGHLASGVYYLRFASGATVETRKVVLIR